MEDVVYEKAFRIGIVDTIFFRNKHTHNKRNPIYIQLNLRGRIHHTILQMTDEAQKSLKIGGVYNVNGILYVLITKHKHQYSRLEALHIGLVTTTVYPFVRMSTPEEFNSCMWIDLVPRPSELPIFGESPIFLQNN